jgi:CheY-like chemotaxis protein
VGSHEVIVIDDEADSRTSLVQILQLEGFRAVAFSNGADALNYMGASGPPCIIILDMRMPVMDGAQFRSAMLQDPRLKKIPVVVVTAFEPAAAANLLALRTFRKPVNVTALLTIVRENC